MVESYERVLSDLREPTKSLRRAIPASWAAFQSLHQAAMTDGEVPARLKEAVALALAVAERCDGCIAYHAQAAARAGATPGEVAELLGWVGLGEHMWSLPPVLSGGEKQRVAIARAVIARPQVLLADEPTGNVDPQLAQRLLRLFIELNKSGTSVVIATHDIALMDQYDARRLVLHDGYIHVYD